MRISFAALGTTLAASMIAGTVYTTGAHAQSAPRQSNPCSTLSADQCKAETHCRYQPAATITYSVAGTDHTRERKARCALAIKAKQAKVATHD
jgi:hypothetical protein